MTKKHGFTSFIHGNHSKFIDILLKFYTTTKIEQHIMQLFQFTPLLVDHCFEIPTRVKFWLFGNFWSFLFGFLVILSFFIFFLFSNFSNKVNQKNTSANHSLPHRMRSLNSMKRVSLNKLIKASTLLNVSMRTEIT